MSILSLASFQCLTADELSDAINLRSTPLTIEMPDGQLLRVCTLESHSMLIMKAMGKYNGESSLNVLNAIHSNRTA